MKRLLVASLIFATPLFAADAVRLNVTLPARIVDGTAIETVVSVELTEGSSVSLPLPTAHRTLRPLVQQLKSSDERACFSHVDEIATGTPSAVTLLRDAPIRVPVKLLEFYPLGFAPGRYALVFTLETNGANGLPATLRSVPVEFEVVAPSAAADRERYDRFRRICGALMRSDHAAPAAAFAFAKEFPDYPLVPGLLRPALQRASDEGTRNELGAFIEHRFTGTELADHAAADRRWRERRSIALRENEQHTAELKRYLAQPGNREEAQAYAQLGGIADAKGFEQREAFLAKYPKSPLAPDVLYDMVIAAENGVLPANRRGDDREAVVRSFRQRLVTEFPKSARAREVAQRLP